MPYNTMISRDPKNPQPMAPDGASALIPEDRGKKSKGGKSKGGKGGKK